MTIAFPSSSSFADARLRMKAIPFAVSTMSTGPSTTGVLVAHLELVGVRLIRVGPSSARLFIDCFLSSRVKQPAPGSRRGHRKSARFCGKGRWRDGRSTPAAGAFASAGLTAAIAWLTVALTLPARTAPAKVSTALFDFRPALRNRSAVAYSLAYCVHTLEMNALRGWGVAFLTWVAASTGLSAGLLSPAVVITVLGLLGTAMSVLGNEASIRLGAGAWSS